MSKIKKKLENGQPYFIAEMSANHGNDLNIALQTVDAAAKAGADCLKVQTYTADTLTLDCDNDYFRIKGGLWNGRKLYDLYSEGSMPWEWHGPIKDRCKELGMDFLSTPFDQSAIDFLIELGCDMLKIASFELVDLPLIEYAASKRKTLILSTGMASLKEIEEAVCAARLHGSEDVILLRCCSEYPANPADMNLASIPDMAARFRCHVGFSDHSEGHTADVVAAALGARVFEKHFCLEGLKTVDSEFSMTPDEFGKMTSAVNAAIKAVGEPCYVPSREEADSMAFRRSIFACAEIKEGDVFTRDNIRIVRPGFGAKPKYYSELLNRKADRDYSFGDPISYKESSADVE